MQHTIRQTENLIIDGKHGKPIVFDARWQESGRPKPVILFIHGFKGFKDWGTFNLIADNLAQSGYVVVKLNLSHNGTTPEKPLDFADLEAFGNNNFSIELDDVRTLTDHLEDSKASPLPQEETDLRRLYLIGHSRGGGLALLAAGEDSRIKAVATWAAISDLSRRWPELYIQDWKEKGVQYIPNSRTGQQMPLYYQLVENFFENEKRLNIPEKVQQMQQPLLAIHGTEDETLPYHMAEDLVAWHPQGRLLIVEGANHTFGGKHPWEEEHLPEDTLKILDETIRFFRTLEEK